MPFSDDEELLTEREVERHIKRSRRQLQRDRAERRGIPFVQISGQVRYRVGDVRAYVLQNLVRWSGEREGLLASKETRND